MTQGIAGWNGTGVGGIGNGGNATGYGVQAATTAAAQEAVATGYTGPLMTGYGNVNDTLFEGPYGVNNNNLSTYNPTGTYGPAINTAETAAAAANAKAGSVLNNAAPVINNPYAAQTNATLSGVNQGQNAAIGALQETAANGQNSAAYQQYQNSLAQNLRAATAVGNSATGGGINAAGARRNAQEQNATSAVNAIAPGQLVAQNAQAAAAGQLGNYLTSQGNLVNSQYANANQAATAQAELIQQQLGTNLQGQQGYNALVQNEQTAQQNALTSAANAVQGSQKVALGQQGINNAQLATYIGAGAGAASGLIGAAGQAANTSPMVGATQGGIAASTAMPAQAAGSSVTGGGINWSNY